MNIIDYIVIGILLVSFVNGTRSGAIRQAIAMLTLVFGTWFAYRMANSMTGDTNKILAFFASFVIIAILSYWMGKIAEKIISIVMLQWLNRLLGGILMMMRSALILIILFQFIFYVNNFFVILPQKYITESILLQIVGDFSAWGISSSNLIRFLTRC